MATNTKNQEDSLTHLKAIINNPNYHQLSDLTPEEQQFFNSLFVFNNGQFGPYSFPSSDQAFFTLKENPDLLDILFISPESDILHQSIAIEYDVLARLVTEYHLSQEELTIAIAKQNPRLTPKQINLLIKIYLINQARLTLEQNRLSPPDTHTTSTIISQTNPKTDPHQTLIELGAQIATTTATAAGITLTREQTNYFVNLLNTSIDLSTPPPQTPIRKHLEAITNPKISQAEQFTAASALIQTLAATPEITSQVFESIRISPIETTTKEVLVQTLEHSISAQKIITDPTRLVSSLQQTPELSTAIGKLPPETPLKEHLSTITNPKISQAEQVAAASALIHTFVSSPDAQQQLTIIITESDLPQPTKTLLIETINQSTPIPPSLENIKTITTILQNNPGISTPLLSITAAAPSPDLVNITPKQEIDPITLEVCLALTTEKYQSPIAAITHQIITATDPIDTSSLLNETNPVSTSTQTSFDPNSVNLPNDSQIDQHTQQFQQKLTQVDADLADKTKQFTAETRIITAAVAMSPATSEILNQISPVATPEFVDKLASAVRHDLPTIAIKAFPDSHSSQAEAIATGLGHHDTAAGIRLHSLVKPEDLKKAVDYAHTHPDSELGKLLSKNPQEFFSAIANENKVKLSTLGHEIDTVQHRTTTVQASLTPSQLSTNQDIFGNIPQLPVISKYLNAITHPIQFIKSWISRKPEDLKEAIYYAHTHPNSELGKLLSENPQEFFSVIAKEKSVELSTLGHEIDAVQHRTTTQTSSTITQPGPIQNVFNKITQPFSSVINRVASFFNNKIPQLPVVGKYLNAVIHPVQFIKSWLGRKLGENFVKQIGHRVGEAFLKRIGSEFAKKAIGTLLKEGLKKGMQLIFKQAAIRGIQVAAQALNAVPGLGLVVAAAIEIGSRILGKIKGVIDKFGLEIWGEKLKPRDLGTAVGALIAAPVAVAVAIATAAVATVATAISTTIIIAAVIGGFFYLSAVTIAPIIGSFAQLGLPTAGIGIGAGTYIPNPNDTFNNSDNSAGACFTFSESIYPWSDQQKTMIRPLVSQLPSGYLSKLCSNGNIELAYGGDNGSIGGFVQDNTISIYDAGFNFYTLAHETGHIYTRHHPDVYQDFANNTGILGEGAVDTYPLSSIAGDTEDFAETIAIYLTQPSYLSLNYPKHYNFIKSHVFN